MSNLPVCISKQNDVIGTDKYRVEDLSLPAAFRPSISHTVRDNNTGTNNNVSIVTKVPVAVTKADGTVASVDAFVSTFKFTSLQHIVAESERALACDLTLQFVTKALNNIKAGMLPTDPISLAP